MTRTPREVVLWSIGILVVLFYALLPVIWIASVSLKAPAEVADRKFHAVLGTGADKQAAPIGRGDAVLLRQPSREDPAVPFDPGVSVEGEDIVQIGAAAGGVEGGGKAGRGRPQDGHVHREVDRPGFLR